MLRLTFLGTASSRPTVTRNVSSLAAQRDGAYFLFDCGEGTQRQMMRFGVGFAVQEIFITHLHADHYLGIPGLLRTMNLQGRQEELVVWGSPDSQGLLKQLVELGGNRLSFRVAIREVVANQSIRFDGFQIELYKTEHTRESMGLVLREDDRLGRFNLERARELGVPDGPLYGRLHRGETVELPDGTRVDPAQLVGPARPGRKVVYTGDTRPCEATIEVARSADLLIHEATFLEEERQRAAETGHSTARQAAEVAETAGVRQLVLTHLSARHSEQWRQVSEEARAVFKACRVAKDGYVVEVPLQDSVAHAEGTERTGTVASR